MTAGPPAHLVRQLLVERAREGSVEEVLWGRRCGGGVVGEACGRRCSTAAVRTEGRPTVSSSNSRAQKRKLQEQHSAFFVAPVAVTLRRPRRLPGYISFLKLKCECTRKIWQRIFFFSSYFTKEIRFQTTPIPPFPGFQHLLSVCFFFLNT